MGKKPETRNAKYKICIIAGLLAGASFLTYYFHAIVEVDTVVTHIFYIPIILAGTWWRRKGLIVAVFSSAFLIFSHASFLPDTSSANDYFRSLMFVVIAFVVAELSERISKKEEYLLDASNFLERLIDSADGPIVVCDPESRITRFNGAFEHLTGYTSDEVIGERIDVLFPTSKRGDSLGNVKRAMSGENWESIEIPILCEDGSIRVALWNSANIYAGDDTTVLATIAQGHDITERIKAVEALEESERFLGRIFDAIQDGVSVLDCDLNIVRTNKWIEEIYGVETPLVGRKCYEAYLSTQSLCPGCPSLLAIKTGESHTAIVGSPCIEKPTRWLQVSAFPLRGADRGVVGVIEHLKDITEYKKAEFAGRDAQERLLEQQRHETERVEAELSKLREELIQKTRLAAIGQVSASIAHDLRNPLGSVRNASYFLRRHVRKEEPKLAEYTQIIDEEVAKADQIITNLLEMARPKVPHKQRVDLGGIIKEVLSLAEGASGVHCEMSMAPDPFVVQADPNQLRQVVGNIVDNAIEAMKGRGCFFVEACRDAGYDTIVFRDTGPGFAPDVKSTVFEPLMTTKASGTGLGLTICSKIIENHGGSIAIEDFEGRGAAVRIRLPR